MKPKCYFTLTEALHSGCPFLTQTTDYLENFLGKPHEKLQELGHAGSVCPFTPKVLNNETVVFGHEHILPSTVTEEIEAALLNAHLPYFLNHIVPNTPESTRNLACLLVVISGLTTEEECTRYVSLVQKKLQPRFVEKGLLLSELHPFSKVPSVRNEHFFPSQSPFPLFFIRKLIPNDIPYILRTDRYDDQTYRELFKNIHSIFGQATVKKEMDRLGKEIILPKCRGLKTGNCSCDANSFQKLLFYGLLAYTESCYTCQCTNNLVRGLGDVFVDM